MKVPGDELQRSEYVDAKKLYEDRQGILRSSSSSGSSGLLGGSGSGTSGGSGVWGSSSSATTYVMPPGGKGWTVQGKLGLPTPPYDRLEFLQAVGVPIGKDSLLVDAAVLKDALEITVQIDEHTLAAAKVKKVGGDRGGPPLAVLTVSGYEFTPVEGSKSTTLKTPAAAEIYAANAFEEMGQTIREVKLKVRSLGEAQSGKFEQHLLAGECAAPVVTDDGILIGFLAGKTDVGADDGGPNNFYPLRDLLSLISQSSSGTAGASSGTGHSSSGLLAAAITAIPAIRGQAVRRAERPRPAIRVQDCWAVRARGRAGRLTVRVAADFWPVGRRAVRATPPADFWAGRRRQGRAPHPPTRPPARRSWCTSSWARSSDV